MDDDDLDDCFDGLSEFAGVDSDADETDEAGD